MAASGGELSAFGCTAERRLALAGGQCCTAPFLHGCFNTTTILRVMATPLMPIEPKGIRWEPSSDPNDITVPGLDTNASVNEQVEQIEQLITIKLQVRPDNFEVWLIRNDMMVSVNAEYRCKLFEDTTSNG